MPPDDKLTYVPVSHSPMWPVYTGFAGNPKLNTVNPKPVYR